MPPETPERISLCYNQVQLYIPKTKEDIARARKLLDMLEEELTEAKPTTRPLSGPELEEYAPAAANPQEYRHGDSCDCDRCEEYRADIPVISAPEPIRLIAIPVKTPVDCAGDQSRLGINTSKPEENAPTAKFDAIVNFFIPKFEWDKTKEKPYRTIFFFEHEDNSRVMMFYLNSRVFTTKEAVMTIPYPVPYNYAPLRAIQNNKRTALKFYREYLATKDEKRREEARCQEDRKMNTRIWKRNEHKDMEKKRIEALRKKAEANKNRWKDRVESEMSPRTKELREKFGIPIRDESAPQ